MLKALSGLLAQSVLVGALFLVAAFAVSNLAFVSFWSIVIWLALANAAFHGLIWLHRSRTTAAELRSLEYVYVAIGLIGILGIFEIQTILLKGRVSDVLQRHASNNVSHADCEAYERDKNLMTRIRCNVENEYNGMFSDYNHGRLGTFLPIYERSDIVDESIKSTVRRMREIYSEMDREVFSHVIDSTSPGWLFLKIMGFYFLLTGVALKIAKTSGEVFRWHV